MRKTAMRATAIVAMVAAASAMLTGCSLASGAPVAEVREPLHVSASVSPADAGKPAAGSCWKATFDGYLQYADWNLTLNGGPISCSKTHQLYTMAVLPLESSHPGAEFNAQDTLEPSILTDAQSTCEHYLDEHIGRVDNQDGRFYYKAFVPVRSEWNAGARWVRCDIHVIKIGSTLAHPALENLPPYATLKKQLRSDPSQFDLCASVPGGTIAAGPRASGAVYASCTGNPQWQLLEYLNLPVPTDGFPYPSASQWKTYFATECVTLADPTQVPVPIYPTKAQWADGNYGFECWAGHK